MYLLRNAFDSILCHFLNYCIGILNRMTSTLVIICLFLQDRFLFTARNNLVTLRLVNFYYYMLWDAPCSIVKIIFWQYCISHFCRFLSIYTYLTLKLRKFKWNAVWNVELQKDPLLCYCIHELSLYSYVFFFHTLCFRLRLN